MRRICVTFVLILFLGGTVFAQLIVDKGIYWVNFSNASQEPGYISYTLYTGRGDCKRKNFHFRNDEPRLECSKDKDYKGSYYDLGHLANAEDFASDCLKDELTFRYYNCLPQTANLNRSIWKSYETIIRKWSQNEQLYIICGGFFGDKMIGKIAVPSYCWKVVQSVTTKMVLFCGWFGNSSPATLEEISTKELENKIKSPVILLK
jgi:endonuclease G, mitochondrial